jgi:hypothetical protein
VASYPNDCAVAGNAWPGAIWLGQPLQGGLALYQFHGPETLVYPDYIDWGAQHTLVAVPGGTYDIYPPPPSLGLPCAPPDGLWTAVEG